MKLTAEAVDFQWDDTEEARFFYRLVACTGFIPIRTTHDDQAAGRAYTRGRPSKTNGGSSSRGANSAENASMSTLDMAEGAQRERARHLARTRTYNMRYLKRRRHWGPFLPLTNPVESTANLPVSSMSATDTGAGGSCDLDAPTNTKATVHASSQDLLLSDTDSSDDPDFVPTEDDGSSIVSLSPVSPPAHVRPPRLAPTPDQLVADWAWLASARIVVEANLREMVGLPDGLNAQLALDNVREGAWIGPSSTPAEFIENSGNVVDVKGKGKDIGEEENSGAMKGWDWAGAEGVWR